MNRQKYDDEKRYYVYGLYDPADDYPFYIGKGSGHRRKVHFMSSCNEHNPHKDNKISKIKREDRDPYSQIIYDKLAEAKAYDKEYILIHFLDAQPDCSLTNIDYTWGAGCGSGKNHPMYGKTRNHSKKARKKMSKAHSGKDISRQARINRSNLSKQEIGEIKWIWNNTTNTSESIARRYETTHGTVTKLGNGKHLDWISPVKPNSLKGLVKSERHLSSKDVSEIKWFLSNTDLTHKEISNKYGVTRPQVTCINTGKSWDAIKPQQPK